MTELSSYYGRRGYGRWGRYGQDRGGYDRDDRYDRYDRNDRDGYDAATIAGRRATSLPIPPRVFLAGFGAVSGARFGAKIARFFSVGF